MLIVHQLGVAVEVVEQPPPGSAHQRRDQRVERDRGVGVGPVAFPDRVGEHRGGKRQQHDGEQHTDVGEVQDPVDAADPGEGLVVVEPDPPDVDERGHVTQVGRPLPEQSDQQLTRGMLG